MTKKSVFNLISKIWFISRHRLGIKWFPKTLWRLREWSSGVRAAQILLLVAVSLFAFACGGSNNDFSEGKNEDVETREYSDGTKVVVIKEDDGSESLMDYAIFMMLMNQGNNYGQIREYHHHHYNNDSGYRSRSDTIRTTTTRTTVKTRTTAKVPLTKYGASSSGVRSGSTSSTGSRSSSTSSSRPATTTKTTTTSRSTSSSSRSSSRR